MPVKQKHKQKDINRFKNSLIEIYYANVRLAVWGMAGAMLTYFIMISQDPSEPDFIPWLAALLVICFLVAGLVYFGEKVISNYRLRLVLADVLIAVAFLISGISFRVFIPELESRGILISAVSLITGVLGAAAFAFSVNRHTFIMIAAAWTFPIFYEWLFLNEDPAFKFLTLMHAIYIAVLVFLGYMDYQRRKELIMTHNSLNREKELVVESSKKLQDTLDMVNKLKKQQDGDYYLTALLLKPLGINLTEGRRIKIEFLIDQKKKFEFRNKHNELGGDLCIASDIKLRDRDFTVFMNADAMGKSLQGASGALVLGAVFHSILERTRVMGAYRNSYPERWLKNTFTELQKVFESFDGSMLVSTVLGLADNDNGFVYFLNAEHPFTVLYRDNKASFLEEKMLYRKLGTPGISGSLKIATFKLEPGDKLIIGSDGRDDILTGHDDSGSRIINEDEKRFLGHVEDSEADLNRLYESILGAGKITDDLSLLTVEFTPQAEKKPGINTDSILRDISEAKQLLLNDRTAEAEKILMSVNTEQIDNPRILRTLIGYFNKLKNYRETARLAEDYVNLVPEDIEYLHIAAYALRKAGLYERAADMGERVRLREPGHIQNLTGLSISYMMMKNYTRAEKMINTILDIDPRNRRAASLKKAVREQQSA